MFWSDEDIGRPAFLDDSAEIHHRDPVAQAAHHGEIMGDEDHRETHLRPELDQEIDDLRLDRDIERRDAFIGDDQFRLDRKGARNADALALPAG